MLTACSQGVATEDHEIGYWQWLRYTWSQDPSHPTPALYTNYIHPPWHPFLPAMQALQFWRQQDRQRAWGGRILG